MVATLYLAQGEAATVTDGLDATTANTGANRYPGTVGGQVSKGTGGLKFATTNPPPGQLFYLEAVGTATNDVVRWVADTPSKTMAVSVLVRSPDVQPPNVSNPSTMGSVRWINVAAQTSGVALRILYDRVDATTGRLILRDAANNNANDIVVMSGAGVALSTWYRFEFLITVGSATAAPFDGKLISDVFDPIGTVPLNATQVNTSTWNLGTNTIGQADLGINGSVTQTQKVGIGWAKFEDGRTTYIGQQLVNTAAAGVSGTQITASAQTGGKSGAYLDPVNYISGASVFFDNAHPRSAGGMGYRIDVPANAYGALGVPHGVANVGVAAFCGKVTKFIDALPSVSERVITARNTGGGRAFQVYITSNGKVRFDNASATLGTSGSAVLVGQQITFEWYCTTGSATTGVLALRAYKNNDPVGGLIYEKLFSPTGTRTDGAAPDGTGTDTGTYNVDSVQLGRGAAIATASSHYFSDLVYTPFVSGAYIGPAAGGAVVSAVEGAVAAVPAAATADAQAPVLGGTTAMSGGGPAQANATATAPGISAGVTEKPPVGTAQASGGNASASGGATGSVTPPAGTATATAAPPVVSAVSSPLTSLGVFMYVNGSWQQLQTFRTW